jgi:hypothetical protein
LAAFLFEIPIGGIKMRRKLMILTALLTLILIVASPTLAIDFGARENGEHSGLVSYDQDYRVFLSLILSHWPLQPPGAPVLNGIDNPDGDGNYTITWSSVPGADDYSLQEDDDPSFAGATLLYSGTATSKEVSGRDIGTYYYRVNASNSSGASNWSNIKSVVVTVPPPSCSVTCGADASSWWTNISCESGPTTSTVVSMLYWDDTRGWVYLYDVDRTYTDSGNTYNILAEYWRVFVGEIVGRVSVRVKGGVFGENEQHCQNY